MSQTWSLPQTLTETCFFGLVAVGWIVLMFEFKATNVADMSQMWFIVLSISEVLYLTSTWGNGPVWLIFFNRLVQPPTSHIIWMATTIWMKSLPDGKEKKHALWEAMEGHWSLDTQVFLNEAWWPWPCSRDGVFTWKAHGCHYYFFLFNAKVATC